LFVGISEEQFMATKALRTAAGVAVTAGLMLAALGAGAQQRPKITGVSHLAVYASDMQATDSYYTKIIGLVAQPDPENKLGKRYAVNATQFVEVLPLPPDAGKNRMDHTAYITESAEGMRVYLAAKDWKTPDKVTAYSDGSTAFRVDDPEGVVVEFVQLPMKSKPVDAPNAPGHHIIHVGFIMHDRAKEDSFYQGLLGFRPYWYGGMKDDKVEWISEQVPDGHDWMEYMMRYEPGLGIPADMSEAVAGILNHFSIGVISIPETVKKLTVENRITGKADKAGKIGRDGKYQLNLYDPDGTRVELMEFKAVEKPCCSEFTATDPAPVK
jgi:catechol 2,3-dioxygenase-like lactoylglutathione lyase family enzyme